MKRSKLNNTNQILLPGLNKQVVFLKNKLNLEDSSILIAGSGSASITNHITSNNTINIIVEDYESLISTRLELPDDRNVEINLMDFERTDFPSEQFDLNHFHLGI